MSRTILGYHGTSLTIAKEILSVGAPFKISQNAYDWLGDGVYFWEYGPVRAWEWARKRHKAEAVVLRARVHLEDCLDLTDLKGTRQLRKAFIVVTERMARLGYKPPRQKGGYRELDRTVINFLASRTDPRIRVVRGAFVEGERLWAESGFWEYTHVQVAVRDVTLISEVHQVEDAYNERF